MQVGRLVVADVCAGDAILMQYLFGVMYDLHPRQNAIKQLVARNYDPCILAAKGFKALKEQTEKRVPPKGCQLETWNDDHGACVFKWNGASVL